MISNNYQSILHLFFRTKSFETRHITYITSQFGLRTFLFFFFFDFLFLKFFLFLNFTKLY